MVQLPAVNIHAARPVSDIRSDIRSDIGSDIHGARTLQMPVVAPIALPSQQGEPRATEAWPAKGSKTDEDNLETMATIQMPQWVEPASDKPSENASEKPKPSLFIPIVVIDDEDE